MNQQAQYINMFRNNQMEAVVLDALIDTHFISFLESKNSNIKFLRIDSDITSNLKDQSKEEDEKETKELSEKIEKLFKDTLNIKGLKIQVEKLKTETTPAIILLSEQSRRMQDLSRLFAGGDAKNMFPAEETLVINRNSKLVKALAESIDDNEKTEERELLVRQIYDIALLGHKPLEPDALSAFIERSIKLMEKIV